MNHKNIGHSLAFYERRDIFSSFMKKPMPLLWNSLDFFFFFGKQKKKQMGEEHGIFFSFSIYQCWVHIYFKLMLHIIEIHFMSIFHYSQQNIFHVLVVIFPLPNNSSLFRLKYRFKCKVTTQSIHQVNYYVL